MATKTDGPGAITSTRKAIKAKCWDCEGRGADPCWEWRVGNCSVTTCALWAYRPYQSRRGKLIPSSLKDKALDEKAMAEIAKTKEWQKAHPVPMCVLAPPCNPAEGYCRGKATHGVQVCSCYKKTAEE